MKKILTISFLLFAFIANAQKTMFASQNNYAAPATPPSLVTNGLILNLNANSYGGFGTTWTDSSTQNNPATL